MSSEAEHPVNSPFKLPRSDSSTSIGTTERYFEEVNVGDVFHSGPHFVFGDDMIKFAREFDPQPFHFDPIAAAASDFGSLSASGWHTAAIVMRLFVTGELRFVGGAIGLGVDELRWPTAVHPGDELLLRTEIIEKRLSRSKPDRGILRIRNRATNQKGDVVLTFTANAMVQRRPAT